MARSLRASGGVLAQARDEIGKRANAFFSGINGRLHCRSSDQSRGASQQALGALSEAGIVTAAPGRVAHGCSNKSLHAETPSTQLFANRSSPILDGSGHGWENAPDLAGRRPWLPSPFLEPAAQRKHKHSAAAPRAATSVPRTLLRILPPAERGGERAERAGGGGDEAAVVHFAAAPAVDSAEPVPSSAAPSPEDGFWQHKHRAWDEEAGKPLIISLDALKGHSAGQAPGERQQQLPPSPSEQSEGQDGPPPWPTSRQLGLEPQKEEGAAAAHTQLAPLVAREFYLPIKAFYIARSLDLRELVEGVSKQKARALARNNVVFRWPDREPLPPMNSSKPGMESVPAHSERYMVAFSYGSVVFINFDHDEQDAALALVSRFSTDRFQEARKDDYGIVLRPSLAGWSQGGHDHIMVKHLDTNNIRVIASVLGQSVALDHYAKQVDAMVNTFSELNRGMEQTGTFTMKRKKLFQLVAAANTTLADVILRLGLLERSDTAWTFAHYAKIWEHLRDDFELDERFESLDFKLNIIQHNVRFFLDILQKRKSDTLEWIIILLIAGEICIGLYEIISAAMKTAAHAS